MKVLDVRAGATRGGEALGGGNLGGPAEIGVCWAPGAELLELLVGNPTLTMPGMPYLGLGTTGSLGACGSAELEDLAGCFGRAPAALKAPPLADVELLKMLPWWIDVFGEPPPAALGELGGTKPGGNKPTFLGPLVYMLPPLA
jgi:hypothetical protein